METAWICRTFLLAVTLVVAISSSNKIYSSENSVVKIDPAFYGPTFDSPHCKKNRCTNEGCHGYLITCKHKADHKDKECSYCPFCDVKCKSCPEESNNCAICCDYHPNYEEVTLKCNHTFGKDCIQQTIASGHSLCPLCRKTLAFKKLKNCEFCHAKIFPFEASCSYSCRYRRSDKYIIHFACQEHTCHERCMKGFVVKNAFLLNEGGTIYFRCPLIHTYGFYDQRELYVEAVPLVSDLEDDKDSIPVKGNASHACELCHRTVKDSQKKIEYTCVYDRDFSLFGTGSKKHLYHKACLGPYAERCCRRNLRGNNVFHCPGDHNDNHDSTSSNSFQFEVKLSDFGFTPQRWQKELCPICEKPVKWDGPDAVPPIYFVDRYGGISEYLSCHRKCFIPYLLRYAKITPSLFKETVTIPCPVRGHTHRTPLIKHEHTEVLEWIEKD